MTFSGAHWPANRAVDLLIGPPRREAGHFAWARTNSTGRFRKSLWIDRNAQPGRWVGDVKITVLISGRFWSHRRATGRFEVTLRTSDARWGICAIKEGTWHATAH